MNYFHSVLKEKSVKVQTNKIYIFGTSPLFFVKWLIQTYLISKISQTFSKKTKL